MQGSSYSPGTWGGSKQDINLILESCQPEWKDPDKKYVKYVASTVTSSLELLVPRHQQIMITGTRIPSSIYRTWHLAVPVIIDVLKEKKIEERYAELFIGTGYEPEVCKIRGLYSLRTLRTYLFFVTLKVHQQIREIQVMILQVDFHKFIWCP